jgi:hypothetical protein
MMEETVIWEKKFIYPHRDDAIASLRMFGKVMGEIDTVNCVSYRFDTSRSDRTACCWDYRNVCDLVYDGGKTAEVWLQTCGAQDHPDCRDMTVSFSFSNQDNAGGEPDEEALQRQIRVILSHMTVVAVRCLGSIPRRVAWIKRFGQRSKSCRKDS